MLRLHLRVCEAIDRKYGVETMAMVDRAAATAALMDIEVLLDQSEATEAGTPEPEPRGPSLRLVPSEAQ